MGEKIQHPSPVLLGVSFGGMIAIEIAKQVPLAKLIIVSSIKTASELPRWMKLTGKFQLHKIFPTRSYKITEGYDNRRLGISNEEERELVNTYREKMDPIYYNWAVHQVLNWKNNWYPGDIVHIHGDHDKIFPVKNLNPTHIIRGWQSHYDPKQGRGCESMHQFCFVNGFTSSTHDKKPSHLRRLQFPINPFNPGNRGSILVIVVLKQPAWHHRN